MSPLGTDSDFTFTVWRWRRLLRIRALRRNRNRRNYPRGSHRDASQWADADVKAGPLSIAHAATLAERVNSIGSL